jgi:CheY-like chemotaxis protein
LLNIQERLQTIDGNLAIDSAPGRGTRVYLEVPKSNLAAVQAAGEPKTPPKESAGPGESRTRARSSNGVSLLVVDDHTIVREGIVNSLGKEPRIRVVGEASDGSEALVAIEQLCPDVVLMDLNMPRLNGIEATREIRRRWPHVRIVGLSVQDESGTAQSMIDAGAEAFLSKSDSAHQMAEAILNVAESDPHGDEPPQRG